MSQTQNENLNNIIDLSTASQETGYHQNYLGLLCRQGILKAFKAGRNWLITRRDLNEFLQTHINGISEVADESGNKIPVHVSNQSLSGTDQHDFDDTTISELPNADAENISSQNSQNIISLSEASKVTGYHQDYLAFLCRTGKLQGSKIGRNWVTTKSALDEFIKNYKNGISEVADETGNKIPVHVTGAIPNNKILADDSNVANVISFSAIPNHQEQVLPATLLGPISAEPSMPVAQQLPTPTVENNFPNQNEGLQNLKSDVLQGLAAKVADLRFSLSEMEQQVEKQKSNNVPVAAVIPAAAISAVAAVKENIFGGDFKNKFAPAVEIEDARLKTNDNADSLSVKPTNLFAAANVKKLFDSFKTQPQISKKVLALCSLIAAVGFAASVGWWWMMGTNAGDVAGQDMKIVYSGNRGGNGSGNQLASGAATSPNHSSGTQGIVVQKNITQNITQLLGQNSDQLYSLIDNRLNQYLAEGKFKGEPGVQGTPGQNGSNGPGGQSFAPITYLQPNPATGFSGGSIISATDFSAQSANIASLQGGTLTMSGASTFNGSAVFNSSVALNGTTTIANLTTTNINPGFTPGSVAFQGPSGLTQDNSNLFYDQTNKRLGIGTSTPSSNLTIVANASSSPLTISSSTGATMFAINSYGNVGIATAPSLGNLSIKQISNGDTLLYAQRATDLAPSGDFINYTNAGGTSLFRVDNGGNVTSSGIINNGAVTITSTTTPQLKVQYDGSNQWSASTSPTGATTFAFSGSAPSSIFIPQLNSVNTFSFQNASSSPVLSIDTQNRRVGINTSTPLITLAVVGQDTTDVFDVASSSGASFLRVTSAGNIGIGTTTPGAALSVVGSALISGNETLLGQLSVSATSTLATTTIAQLTVSGTSSLATTTLSMLTVNSSELLNGPLTVNGISTLATTTLAQLTISGNELTSGNATTTMTSTLA